MSEPRLVDRQAEEGLIGALIVDPDSYYRVADIVSAKSFGLDRCRAAFSAISTLANEQAPIDQITIIDAMRRQGGTDEAGWPSFFLGCVAGVPSGMWAERYADIVASYYQRRMMLELAQKLVIDVHDMEQSPDQVEAKMHERLSWIAAQGGPKGSTAEEVASDHSKLIKGRATTGQGTGLKSGWGTFDEMYSGPRPGDLVTIAARPGMGKSAFLLNHAQHVAEDYGPVAFFSLEMSSVQLVNRMLSAMCSIDGNRLMDGRLHSEEWEIYDKTVPYVASLPIRFYTARTLPQLCGTVRRLKAVGDLQAAYVDYLQLLEPDRRNNNRAVEVGGMTQMLKSLAVECRIAIMLASQLSRAVEQRQDKQPVLSDLRESGSIEQDSDVVMFIYRDAYYNPDTDRPNLADLIKAKDRNGPAPRTVTLLWRPTTTSFMSIARPEVQDELKF